MSVDLDMMEVEQVVVGEEIETPVDLASDSTGDSYKVIIKEPPAPMLSQPYQHDNLQCFQCFITFCNSKAKERHMKKSHREEYKQQLQQSDTLFTCYVCDRSFPSSEELTEHQAVHNKEDKPFKCPHCQDSFRTFSELTSHRRHICLERQCVCRDCGETFRGIYLLRTHRASCHPQRPERDPGENESKTHQTGEAAKTTEPVNGEKTGMQRKTGEGSQTEEEKAEAAGKGKTKGRRGRPPKLAQKANLIPGQAEAEEQEEAGVRPQPAQYPCPECEASFPATSQLRAHKKEKHGRPPPPRKAHACKDCEESFSRPEQLEAHTSRVHSLGRHTCPTCGKSFGRENSLKAHQQTHTITVGAVDGGMR
ncbi:hypothetical protein AAFF_G00293210 [Aldrovandia affinis]|uniref:C2H2-type domain-containing protein n=1 Tax=Aldrovandia affinis TaxID=143900 RepID=A0AAD7SQR8_9TELE|nr:hypothetical protein AAFF_G00293210 [Aldrovandia affinis]